MRMGSRTVDSESKVETKSGSTNASKHIAGPGEDIDKAHYELHQLSQLGL